MIQLPDTQLQVSLRALREVIAPALQGGESHVVEQLHLCIATLDYARQRLPYSRRYCRLELQRYLAFAGEVESLIASAQPELSAEFGAQRESGQEALSSPEAEIEDYLVVTRRLRELIANAISASSGTDYERQLDTLVMSKQKPMLRRQRTWYAPLGLDPSPDELPALEDVLRGDE